MQESNIKEEVRAKIIEANPDLLKLSFGCVVEQDQDVGFNKTIGNAPSRIIQRDIMTDGWNVQTFDCGFDTIKKEEILKIIGHPIHLKKNLGKPSPPSTSKGRRMD